jgi:hypothetical protein
VVERAACADIADQHNSCEGIAQKIAAAIRARGECAEDPRLAQAREALGIVLHDYQYRQKWWTEAKGEDELTEIAMHQALVEDAFTALGGAE